MTISIKGDFWDPEFLRSRGPTRAIAYSIKRPWGKKSRPTLVYADPRLIEANQGNPACIGITAHLRYDFRCQVLSRGIEIQVDLGPSITFGVGDKQDESRELGRSDSILPEIHRLSSKFAGRSLHVSSRSPPEFTSWRKRNNEVGARRLRLQISHNHMGQICQFKGPDAFRLLNSLGGQQLRAKFAPGKAKQFVVLQLRGATFIGDVVSVLSRGECELLLVGRAPAMNWVQYHGTTGGYGRPQFERRDPLAAPILAAQPIVFSDYYRYQIQGPETLPQLFERLNWWSRTGGFKFFCFWEKSISVRYRADALRHSMFRCPWDLRSGGPYAERAGGARHDHRRLEGKWDCA